MEGNTYDSMNRLRVTTGLTVLNTFASVATGLILANLLTVKSGGFIVSGMTHPFPFTVAVALALTSWVRANVAFTRGDISVSYWALFGLIVSLSAIIVALLLLMANESIGFLFLGVHLLIWGVLGWVGRPASSSERSSELAIADSMDIKDIERIVYVLVTIFGLALIVGALIAFVLNNDFWSYGPILTLVSILFEFFLLHLLDRAPICQVAPIGIASINPETSGFSHQETKG